AKMEKFWPNSRQYYSANAGVYFPFVDPNNQTINVTCNDFYEAYDFAGVLRNPKKFMTYDQINDRLAQVVKEVDALSANVSVEFVPGALDVRNGGPSVDTSLLALDCYHPERKGHEAIANILWNHI